MIYFSGILDVDFKFNLSLYTFILDAGISFTTW